MNLPDAAAEAGDGAESSSPISSKSSSRLAAFEIGTAGGADPNDLVSGVVWTCAADIVDVEFAAAAGIWVFAGPAASDTEADAAPLPLAGSLLRSSPRATRSVPLACSMLMGLVRTRLAPMRNALATPA